MANVPDNFGIHISEAEMTVNDQDTITDIEVTVGDIIVVPVYITVPVGMTLEAQVTVEILLYFRQQYCTIVFDCRAAQ